MTAAPARTIPSTSAQRRAVEARDNVLVMAGAGTGKTKTLVDRCLHCLENDGAQVDELLIVTFTEAAAAELRVRLRKILEEKAAAQPSEYFWPEQLARFDLAHIGTLHSFCSKLAGEHFYELGLDPQLSILDEGEARQLAGETLDEQFTVHYEGKADFSPAVQELISVHGAGRDENIRKLVLRLHHYSQARPDAAGWLVEQRKNFSDGQPVEWQHRLMTAIADWRDEWLPVLADLKTENEKAAELTDILSRLKEDFSRASAAETLEQIAAADATASYPRGKAGKLRPALEKIFEEAKFLASLAGIKNGHDPLAEDWAWVRGQMDTLLGLAAEFSEKFSARKRADGVVDFHDLEQFALKLLWDFSANRPTTIAEQWREKLKFVFVDEYQDINAAQDRIITALARDGQDANRFLVGDVKQSIYRFRLADPKIFRDYAHSWRGPAGKTIPLSDNFRSREMLLSFTNSLFQLVMRKEIGGVEYDHDAELKFGSPETREVFSAKSDPAPRAELLVRFKTGRDKKPEAEEGDELAGLDDTQREARLVARRLKQLFDTKHEIFDDDKKIFRPFEWRDAAILLRSPRGRSEIFAKEFERAGIPLAVVRGGFYQSVEILDLLSLLELLDNPLQDVPCIAVLRSPLAGLSLDELAEIRLAAQEKHFWTALNRFHDLKSNDPGPLTSKIGRFLERFFRWRKMAKLVSLSQCLEEILSETYYTDWLRAQSRGGQRAANVASFLNLAQSFDQFQRQGLFRFLKFIEAQRENEVEPEVPAIAAENAVRLMSIHQSKGLEFPVVVLADLAKSFNEQDLRGEIIFDEELGLCPKIKPPHAGGRYPSLPHWLAQRRQKRELRGEELRLLYVALTRARDHLILTASVSEKNWEETWNQPRLPTVQKISSAKSFADWLALWFSNQNGAPKTLHQQIVADNELVDKSETANPKSETVMPELGEVELKTLRGRLEWTYPSLAAARRKAKASVTELRRAAEDADDEAEHLFPAVHFEQTGSPKSKPRNLKLSAPEIGAAHHKFLEHFDLGRADFSAEAERLVNENRLSPDERSVLDLDGLKKFWESDLGTRIRAKPQAVRRELPFTARFSPAEIAKITGQKLEAGQEHEFVVVQGVADLAVILPGEIWLVDFKTDEVSPRELPAKIKTYKPQLQLYAAALERIFSRKVTKRALHFLSARRTEEV
jgi:ATP-dependent helicase/nuclease subunit A